MSNGTKLSHVCPFKLSETYHTLYEQQQKLGISDEYLLSTSRGATENGDHCKSLEILLESSRKTRDNLITWYLKQTLVELNVTISLLTAKIKFIEYKLGLCDGLDLHQACSLSLVNFCNILADLTVVNKSPPERKTMHKISAEANVPVWLSHYRNQICHVPSESPCIAILVPLVVKSLNYMQQSFWTKVLEYDTFDERKFKKLMTYVANLIYVTSMNKRLRLKKGTDLGKKRQKAVEHNIIKYSKVCLSLRRVLLQNPQRGTDILTSFMTSFDNQDKTKNLALLLEQVIFARCFERFVLKIVSLVEQNPADKKTLAWLRLVIELISMRKKFQLKETLRKMELSASVQIIKYTDIPPIKCCQIAYRLMKMDSPIVRKLVIKMRHRLLPVLGKQRTILLVKLTRINGCGKNL